MEEEANLVSPDPQGSEGHSDPTQQDLEIERPRRSPYERREPEELPEGALTPVGDLVEQKPDGDVEVTRLWVLGGIARLGRYMRPTRQEIKEASREGKLYWVSPVTATLPDVDLAREAPPVKLSDCKGPRFSGPWLRETLSPVVPEFTMESWADELDELMDQGAPPVWLPCELAPGWRFDQIRAIADQESASLVECLPNSPHQAGALVLFVHTLEAALRQVHPNLTVSVVAHFWRSREALSWLQARYTAMDQAGVPPNVLTNAGDYVMRRLRDYVRRVETLSTPAPLSPSTSEGTPPPQIAPQPQTGPQGQTPCTPGRPRLVTPEQQSAAQKILQEVAREYGDDWSRSPRSGDAMLKIGGGYDEAKIDVPAPWREYGIKTWEAAASGDDTQTGQTLPQNWKARVVKAMRYRAYPKERR